MNVNCFSALMLRIMTIFWVTTQSLLLILKMPAVCPETHLMRLPSFSSIRVTFLLIVLLCVGFVSLTQLVYTRNWNQTLQVTVFPINADGHIATSDYIENLEASTFSIIDRWAIREARRYDLDLEQPFKVSLGEQVKSQPPPWPENDNEIAVLFWGLRFRWWAYQNTPDDDGGLTRIRMFVMYHSGESDKPLAHSLGLQKGLIGLVHAFAIDEQTSQNNIVIAHEMLHTVGAIDKYSEFGSPIYPIGYANAQREPLFPQRYAEIMTGRIPTSYGSSYMAASMRSTQINEFTANEINWLK